MAENTLWVEKYRPKDLNSFIGNATIKEQVKKYIEENDPPHILFYGKPGTGKTTLAQIIAKHTNSDVEYINASDETSVDVIRSRVKTFASLNSYLDLRLVILDEFDFMSLNAQAALRHLMEYFSEVTRFILTCNFHEKILEAIKSRAQTFHVVPPSRTEVATHLSEILTKEQIQFKIEDIALLIDVNYPDIRKAINHAQQSSFDGTLKINKQEIVDADFRMKLVDILTNNKGKTAFTEIRQLVANNRLTDFTDVYKFIYDHIDEFAPNNISDMIVILNEGQRNDAFVVDKEINFMNTIIEIIVKLGEK